MTRSTEVVLRADDLMREVHFVIQEHFQKDEIVIKFVNQLDEKRLTAEQVFENVLGIKNTCEGATLQFDQLKLVFSII